MNREMISKKATGIEFALIVSIFAVVLSQFKPLYTYLEEPEVDFYLGSNASIYENWGNIQANFYLQVVNKGSATGIVQKVEFFLINNSSDQHKRLVGQSFYLQPGAVSTNEIVSQIPLSNISIEPEGVWSSFINSFPDYPKFQERKVAEFTQRVEQDISPRIVQGGLPVPMSQTLFKEIIEFTRSNTIGFEKGEYSLLALMWVGSDKEPSLKKGYNFSVYESDIAKLQVKEQEMRYGGGILYPIPNVKQHTVSFNIKMTEIKDQDQLIDIYKDYLSL